MKNIRLVLVLALIPVLCLSVFPEFARSEGSAIVWTNEKEYFPDDVVSVFGYGFNPFTDVTIHIVRPDFVEHYVYTVTDEFGYFFSEYQLDGVHGTYNLTATDGVNVAATSFENCLHLKVRWHSNCCWFIKVKAVALRSWRSYYVKYYDPNGVERRTSPTHTGVMWFEDNFTILPSLPHILGTWTVKLYEDSTLSRTKTVCIDRMVWTTDSTYNNLITSFNQGETIYFKTIGLKANKYYRFMFEKPSGTKFYVGDWTTGATNLTGSYVLPPDAEIGSWKLHVREASDVSGTCEHHYVDTCYFEVRTSPPPPQYYLTVQTTPSGVTTIPGEGWYTANTYVNLTAPELIPGISEGIRYKFYYWDVDGIPYSEGVNPITVYMDENHTATAHYLTQYYLNVTSDPPSVTIPAGSGWYNRSESAPIYTPEFVGITPEQSRYRFDGWTTANMSEIVNSSACSTTVYMDEPKTVTVHYVIQYKITFDHSGVSPDFTGTTLTVDGTEYGVNDLPISFWWDKNSIHNFSFHSPLVVTPNVKRYVWISTSGLSSQQGDTLTVTTAGNVTGNYKTQYLATFDHAGLDGTATGTVVTVNDTQLNYAELPFTIWVNESSWISYAYNDVVPSTVPGKRFQLVSITGPPSPFHVTEPVTVTGGYKTQYQITVTASPSEALGGTFKVIYTQCGTTYTNLQKITTWTEWVDASTTVTVSEPQDIINVASDTRYKFDHYDPSYSVTMDNAKTITLVYKTQYYLTVRTNPSGLSPAPSPPSNWYDASTEVVLTAPSASSLGSVKYAFDYWDVDGPPKPGNPIRVSMDGPHIATAHYTEIPQGGYSVSLSKNAPTRHLINYAMLIALFGAALSLLRRKRK